MLSIRTNLTSLLAQNSLRTSSNKLNQAIERMTTGFKINNAKDNAANYSISTNLSTKIGAYQVAEENTAMGLDMVTTASETLSLIEDKLSRARALCVQAQNGTYGAQSLDAIKSELGAIVDELVRTKEDAQYNDINLFGKEGMPVANPETGFIADVVVQNPEVTVSDPAQLLDAIENHSIIGISNAQTLAELANIVNSDLHNCEGKTIVLTEDIDLSGYSNWTPIGWYDASNSNSHVFKGDFNGNGHIILNLKITDKSYDGIGLFGGVSCSSLLNLGLENVDVNIAGGDTNHLGSLVGVMSDGLVSNCYVKGNIVSKGYRVGLLCGTLGGTYSRIVNSYSEGNVEAANTVGGLAAWVSGECINCYSNTNVSSPYGISNAGGLVSVVTKGIKNCYATGDVIATKTNVGGLCGVNRGVMENCFATGNVTGTSNVGGLVGSLSQSGRPTVGSINNSYSTGTVSLSSGNSTQIGGLVGNNDGTVTNSYWDIEKSGITTSPHGEGKMTAELNELIISGVLPSIANYGVPRGANSNLQIGISDDTYSSIGLDFGLTTSEILAIKNSPTSAYSLATIDYMLSKVTTKQTELGAAENRLMSALEEISIKYENLVSTRSTIRDADISEVSSQYIQQQILQQASSTLLATANQSPDLALRLIMNSTI